MVKPGHAAIGLFLASCGSDLNPCPPGSIPNRVELRCVQVLDEVQSDDAGRERSEENVDAAPPHTIDILEGGAQDVGLMFGDDAGLDASGTVSTCSPQDVRAWSDFHLNDGAVDTLNRCAEERCDGGTCYPSECIRGATGLVACNACVDAESACVLEFCRSACGTPGNDAECRACVCEAGCTTRFEVCAEAPLNVCERVHGRDPEDDDELELQGPWLLLMKGFTGLLRIGPLSPSPPPWSTLYAANHLSKGFTHAVPFHAYGRQYLLQHKSQGGNSPCVARISLVLSDGSLGRPVYMETWTSGWDEIEAFQVQGRPYLLRYKTGKTVPTGEPTGHLKIERMQFSDDLSRLALEPVVDLANTPVNAAPWSHIEALDLAGETYLLRYGTQRNGEVQLLRLTSSEESIALSPATNGLQWARDWDLVEAFHDQGLPYVLLYRRSASDGEAAGQLRVMRIVAPSAGSLDMISTSKATWSPTLTHVLPFRQDGKLHVLSYSPISRQVSLYMLGDRQESWSADLAHPTWTSVGNGTSPWDILAILQGAQRTP